MKALLAFVVMLAVADLGAPAQGQELRTGRPAPTAPLKETGPLKQAGPLKETTPTVSRAQEGPYCHYEPNRYTSFLGTSVWSSQAAKADAVDQAVQWCGGHGATTGRCTDEHPRCVVSVDEVGAGTESKGLKYEYTSTFRCAASCER
jgi:hypothetical protein